MALTREISRPTRPVNPTSYLDSLIPIKPGEREIDGLKLIDRERIVVGDQPRRSFPVDEQKELTNNIRELKERQDGIESTGLLLPLLVVPQDDKYLLVAGERRYRATAPTSTWVGVEALPCIVIHADANSVRLMQLIENLQRQALPPLEEAEGIQNLMTTQRLSYRDVARLLGKDKGYIENRIRLLKAGEDVQNMVSLRKDTLSHAYEIDRIPHAKLRKQLIKTVLNEGASVSEVRRRIEAFAAANAPAPGAPGTFAACIAASTHGSPANRSNGANGHTNGHRNALNDSALNDSNATNGGVTGAASHVDPLATALRPAVSLLAEATRQFTNQTLTPTYRNAVLREVALMEKQIEQLKAVVG